MINNSHTSNIQLIVLFIINKYQTTRFPYFNSNEQQYLKSINTLTTNYHCGKNVAKPHEEIMLEKTEF